MALTMILTGCFSSKAASSAGRGGEVVGVSGRSFAEPAPYGMVRVGRGYLRMGLEKQDSLWGKQTPVKDISVDGFWMDETEVTNSKYKQFVVWVRDSIIRTRLADPQYGGDETYMITNCRASPTRTSYALSRAYILVTLSPARRCSTTVR